MGTVDYLTWSVLAMLGAFGSTMMLVVAERVYGIWWFNRTERKERQVAEVGENGRRYRRRSKNTTKPPEE